MNNKGQHTVTRAYIEGFVDPATPSGMEPYVWVHERGANEPFRKAPKKLTVRSDYYAFREPSGERNLAAEVLLGHFEGPAIPVLRALSSGRPPSDLSEQERATFAFFVALLAVRVPRFRDHIEHMVGDIAKHLHQTAASNPPYYERLMRDAHQSKGLEPPDDIEAIRQFALAGDYDVRGAPMHSLQVMVTTAPRIAYYVDCCQWRVLEAPNGAAFVTSDGPLVQVTTSTYAPRWGGVGWETPYMEATLPLTPSSCLLLSMHHPEGRERVSPGIVREVNARTAAHALEQVYTSRRIDPRELEPAPRQRHWRPVTDALREPATDDGSDTK